MAAVMLVIPATGCATGPDHKKLAAQLDGALQECDNKFPYGKDAVALIISCGNEAIYKYGTQDGVSYDVLHELTARRTQIGYDLASGRITFKQAQQLIAEAASEAGSHDIAIKRTQADQRRAEINQAVAVGAQNLRNSLPQQTICNGTNYGVTYGASCTTYHY